MTAPGGFEQMSYVIACLQLWGICHLQFPVTLLGLCRRTRVSGGKNEWVSVRAFHLVLDMLSSTASSEWEVCSLVQARSASICAHQANLGSPSVCAVYARHVPHRQMGTYRWVSTLLLPRDLKSLVRCLGSSGWNLQGAQLVPLIRPSQISWILRLSLKELLLYMMLQIERDWNHAALYINCLLNTVVEKFAWKISLPVSGEFWNAACQNYVVKLASRC